MVDKKLAVVIIGGNWGLTLNPSAERRGVDRGRKESGK